MTLTDIIEDGQDAVGTTKAAVKTYLIKRINIRYQQVADKLKTFENSATLTAATVAEQQYYHNPIALKSIENIAVSVDDTTYNATPVNSVDKWNKLNIIDVNSDIVQKFFRRKNDYGLWPIPSSANTITITYTKTAVPMTSEDYVEGDVTVTENSQTVTGNGTTWSGTNAKIGYWFSLADSNGEPRGNWYRISAVGSTTSITLETFFEEVGESGASYIIGETPEVPEEAHPLISIGAVADYFMFKRKDTKTGKEFNNMFWTGSPNITASFARDTNPKMGGLLGLIASVEDRDDDSAIVERDQGRRGDDIEDFLAWGSTISES